MPKGEQNWFAAGRNCLAVHKRLDPAVLTQAKLLVQHSAQHFKYGIFSVFKLSVQKQSNASAPFIYQCARVSVCVCISVAGAKVSFSWPCLAACWAGWPQAPPCLEVCVWAVFTMHSLNRAAGISKAAWKIKARCCPTQMLGQEEGCLKERQRGPIEVCQHSHCLWNAEWSGRWEGIVGGKSCRWHKITQDTQAGSWLQRAVKIFCGAE